MKVELGPSRCGFVTAPESRTGRSNATLRLPVMIAEATNPTDKNAPPLVMLAGGPGGPSLSFAGALAEGQDLAVLRRSRDVVLVNERGVTYSEPTLNCTELDALIPGVLGADHRIHEISSDDRLAATDACFKRWTNAGVDPASYNLLEMTSDVHDAMHVLGYSEYAIYGVSFGTMFAQEIAKRFPSEVRALVLDSAVPLDQNFLWGLPAGVGHSLQTIFDSCAADSTCSTKYPDLRAALVSEVQTFNATPSPFSVPDPSSPGGTRYDSQLTGDQIVAVIDGNKTPGPNGVAIIPSMIHQLEPNSPTQSAVLNLVEQVIGSSVVPLKDSDHGMALSVLCSAWAPQDPNLLTDNGDPLVTGFVTLIKPRLAECTKWTVPSGPEVWPEMNDALVSDMLPALILPAKFDAFGPENGARIASGLQRAFVHVWPDRGHAMSDFKCAGPIMDAFLSDPSRDPDASCIESQSVPWQ
jgi:pimeloyl-ACP methyl ester carboxylesterase